MARVFTLPQTGERFLPIESGQNRYEHLHRYLVCSKFVRGKDVLDIASGEGYGAAMMARSARQVTGVDISAEAVAHGRRTYYDDNLRFLVGDCAAIPLADSSVDVVTSFETLEHHAKHDEMMSEVKRVLREDGTLIISSPNKLVYSDEVGFTNPFHVRELYFDEFSELCHRYFADVQMYGQFMGAASFVLPLSDAASATLTSYGSSSGDAHRGLAGPKLPMYFVAVCSTKRNHKVGLGSLFLDIEEDFFGQLTRPQVRRIEQVQQQPQLSQGHVPALPSPASHSLSGENDATVLRARLAETMRSLHSVTEQLARVHEDLSDARGAAIGATESVADEAMVLAAEQGRALAEAEIRERDDRIAVLTAQLEAERSATARAVELSAERNQRIIAYNTTLWRTSSSVSHWRKVASVLAAELEETTVALVDARTQLNGMLDSRSWRLVGALRNAKATLTGGSGAIAP